MQYPQRTKFVLRVLIAPLAALGWLALAPAAAAGDGAVLAQNPPVVWKLTDLYPNLDAWERERQALLADLPRLKKLQGSLGGSASSLQQGLDQISAVNRRLVRLATYANLQADENTQVNAAQERRQLVASLANQVGEATAFVSPEIAAIGKDTINAYLASDPGLASIGKICKPFCDWLNTL